MTATLVYPPVRDGYGFTPGAGYIHTRLEGGAARVRKDLLEPPHTIQVNLVLRANEYTEFMGFFHSTLEEGVQPFLVELLGDLSILTTHKARCVEGGRPRLTGNKGDAFYVAATLEVENNATYTGTLRFSYNSASLTPDPRVSATALGVTLSQYQIGDSFRIHRAINSTPLNFDGLYTITDLPFAGNLACAAGALVSTSWAAIDPGFVDIPSTITRVPT